MDIRNLTVEVRDKNLNRLGQINLDDLDLLVEDQFSNVGSWTLNLRSDHPLADAICTPGAGLIVSDTSGNTLMSGPVTETDDKATIEDPGGTITINGLSDTLIFADRLAFPDPSNPDLDTQAEAQDVRTGLAEDLMHAYVTANIGPSAPSVRRISSLQMGTNGHRGPTLTKRPRFDVLGNLLNELGLASGLGFRILQVAGHLEFQTFAVNDRSDDVRYDIYNNMLSGHSAQSAPPGVTRAIVAGDGAKIDRPFVEVTTSDSLAGESLWGRRIEKFVDQRSTTDPTELTQAGKDALADAGFAQTGIQVVPMEDIGVGDYGNKFVLGDYVTVVIKGIQFSVQVTGYVLKRNSDGFKFGLVLGNPGAKTDAAQVTATVTKLEGRVSNLERNAEGGAGVLADLSDVVISSPANRNILQWDGATGKWVNKATVVLSAVDSTTDVYATAQPSDTNNRWKVKGDGATWWGPGNATQDTNLYRAAAGVLKTDGDLQLLNGNNIDIGGSGSSASFTTKRANFGDFAFSTKFGTDVDNRMFINAGGTLMFGDGTNAPDTNLYRSTADTLQTDDNFRLPNGRNIDIGGSGSSASFATKRSGQFDPAYTARFGTDPNDRIRIHAGGRFEWGDGTVTDTSLFRSAAGVLATDGDLQVAGVAHGRGVVYYQRFTSSFTAAISTADQLVFLTSNIGFAPGRAFRVTFRSQCNCQVLQNPAFTIKLNNVGGQSLIVWPRTIISIANLNFPVDAQDVIVNTLATPKFNPLAVVVTPSSTAASSAVVVAAAPAPSTTFILVEDVGPASAFPGSIALV